MNAPSSSQQISFATLVEMIGSTSLVASDVWSSVVEQAQGDPQLLMEAIMRQGLLSHFQLQAIGEGRGDSLRVGNYEILDRLGAGGMGTVFKARHRRMKRIVALKVLSANLSGNQLFVKRFQREVETIASLGHPNVVMAYDADEAEIGHFLVMEFVNGIDLAAYVQRYGPMSIPLAVDCVLQAARGLAYAHAQELVHRDIKPHNLLRDDQGVVKVTDLGLARLSQDADTPAAQEEVTMAGGVIGTAAYMSPEQAIDSTAIDHRADIYSLGCTLHFLLTGKAPYAGATVMALLLQHRDADIPSLLAARADCPVRLDEIYRRMMAKLPEGRYQAMSQVVADLEALAATLERVPGTPSATAASTEFHASDTRSANSQGTAPLTDLTVALGPSAAVATVLVVEPSRVQASIIKSYCQEQLYDVVGTAAQGTGAIETVRRLRPRAVISAMHLADMNGLELAEKIRAEITADAPGFVLVTSEGAELDAAALCQLHRVLLLPKPFTATQLSAALEQVIGATGAIPACVTTAINGANRPTARNDLRVMIVDDSAAARMHVRDVLKRLGITQFVDYPDGAHAIAAASPATCDLIVTDYNMPLMDGRALVSYLKQNPATQGIPIIMFTSETDPRLLDPVRRLGVVDILEKSFPMEKVNALLDSLF